VSSVMMTLDSSDGGLSDGMVIKSEWILPLGLVMLTLTSELAAGVGSNEGDLGRGMRAGKICGIEWREAHHTLPGVDGGCVMRGACHPEAEIEIEGQVREEGGRGRGR
jgi:hypothetical protein